MIFKWLTVLSVLIISIFMCDASARGRRSKKVQVNSKNINQVVAPRKMDVGKALEPVTPVNYQFYQGVEDDGEGGMKPMAILNNKEPLEKGDQVILNIIEDRDDPKIIFVDELGFVYIPLGGKVQALGKTCKQLAFDIKKELETTYYKNATVLISFRVDDGRGRVLIFGEVLKQGALELPLDELFTVSKAILAAGGFTSSANPTKVSVLRSDVTNPSNNKKYIIDLNLILQEGKLEKDMVLLPGDRVVVPNMGATVGKIIVTGAVRAPGTYSIPIGKGMTVVDAILNAGGFTEFADQTVKVNRVDSETGQEKIIKVNVDDVLQGNRKKDINLEAGDMIIVSEKWFNF